MPAQAEIAEPETRTKKKGEERADAKARMDEQGGPPRLEAAPAATPNFTPRQGYRVAAPEGIDVAYAWTRAGGRGAGIGVIDCEGAWRFTHEDLIQNQGGVIGPESTALEWRNHGTAVTGVIGADDNGFGALGIAPDARVRGSSIFGPGGLPDAIQKAADALSAGDIILIEVQYGNPVRGYTSVERWPAEYAAIRYAISHGVIVVEAAANGASNLDDALYDTPEAGFPADWVNPSVAEPGTRARSSSAPGRRLRERTAGTTGPTDPGSRPRTRVDGRRAGLGTGGDHLRLRGPAGRRQRGPLVHRRLQEHLRRLAANRRCPRLRAGRPARRRARCSRRPPRAACCGRPARPSRTRPAGPPPSGSAIGRTCGR